jgi:hypothetical protein
MQLMEHIQAEIVSLDLVGIPNGGVLIQKRLSDQEKYLLASPNNYPVILIAPETETIQPNGGTNIEDDIGYPVSVVILDDDSYDQELNFDRDLLWREQIIRNLHNQRAAGVPSIRRLTVTPGAVIDPATWSKAGLWVSSLRVNAETRNLRP